MGFALALAGFLVLYNNAIHLLGWHDALYVPLNLGVAAAILTLARRQGLRWAQLGIEPGWLRRGLAWGGTLAALVAAAYLLAFAWVPGREVLADRRYVGLGPAELAYHVLVRIPFGTVVLEELAFRGVLLGAADRAGPTPAAVMVSSLAFGLWHIRPTIGALGVNELAAGAPSAVLAVGAAVVFTAAAGVLFCVLRLRARSLLAPALLHVGTNSFGAVAATFAARTG